MSIKNELEKLVGRDNVADDSNTLLEYSKDFSFQSQRMPTFVVRPKSSMEVEQLVKLANKASFTLVPVSSGPPRFRGDTISSRGEVIMDLSGLNKIKAIFREDRVAMIEPGIRWEELQVALSKEGMRIPMPLSPRKTKSVVGSCLEREPHTIPKYHLDSSDPMLCTEVVFGSGDTFRTGDAAGPGTIEEQWEAKRFQKQQHGIQMDTFRLLQGSQGSFGIVTWSTVRCEILPKIQKSFLVSSEKLDELLELQRWLVRRRLVDEVFILNNVNFASLAETDADNIEKLSKTLPPWILLYTLAGYDQLPEERIDYIQSDVGELANSVGVFSSPAIAGINARKMMALAGSPSEDPYWKIRRKGNNQDLLFISSFGEISKFVQIIRKTARSKRYAGSDIGVYIQPVCQGHGYHCEFGLPYDPDDQKEKELVKELYISGAEKLMNAGAFFSRPYDLLSDMVMNRDATTREVLRKLKRIYDPNGVLNPDKLCFGGEQWL